MFKTFDFTKLFFLFLDDELKNKYGYGFFEKTKNNGIK